jgi:hypothetical protein
MGGSDDISDFTGAAVSSNHWALGVLTLDHSTSMDNPDIYYSYMGVNTPDVCLACTSTSYTDTPRVDIGNYLNYLHEEVYKPGYSPYDSNHNYPNSSNP